MKSIWLALKNKESHNNDEKADKYRKIRAIIIILFFIPVIILIKHLVSQRITSVSDLQDYMLTLGMIAPIFLTMFQAFQVVIPIVPGYLGCAAGAMAFGTATGFLCNYIGISIGSIIAYFLARRYGKDFVLTLFSDKQYDKWCSRIEKSRSYDRFLFIATLLPLFPDDFLCYFSGLIGMDRRRFIWIIILGKPWCILAYSIGFGLIK